MTLLQDLDIRRIGFNRETPGRRTNTGSYIQIGSTSRSKINYVPKWSGLSKKGRYVVTPVVKSTVNQKVLLSKVLLCIVPLARLLYLMMSEMVPAPTVRPPSRMAKRRPFSMATGVCSVISS